MSGFAAPLRTKAPTPTFAKVTRLSSHDFALRLKLVDPWRRAYHDIGSLTLLNTVRDTARRTVGDRYFVSRGFFKIRYQCVNCRMQSHGA